MRTTQQMSITLPNEMAEFVRTKVASGDYASDSEVLRDALRVLREHDRAVEAWLRNEVVPSASTSGRSKPCTISRPGTCN